MAERRWVHDLFLIMITRERVRGLVRPRKGLGQHFLIDREVLERVVSAAELSPQDIVIEVGPGLGTLTRELAARVGRVIAIEVDGRLASRLERRLSHLGNVTIINGDVLKSDMTELLGDSPSYKVVANIPYYITSPILRHFIEAPMKPSIMVVMVQREVAEAIVAKIGDMSLLSVGVQFYGRPVIIEYVAARSFYPRPKVESAILRIDLYQRPAVEVDDVAAFFSVITAGFSTPRKQLHNALARGLGMKPGECATMLEGVGIDPMRRAETLTLEEWARVYAQVR